MDHLSEWSTNGLEVCVPFAAVMTKNSLSRVLWVWMWETFPQLEHASWFPLCYIQSSFFLNLYAILWKVCVTASTISFVVGSLKSFFIMSVVAFSSVSSESSWSFFDIGTSCTPTKSCSPTTTWSWISLFLQQSSKDMVFGKAVQGIMIGYYDQGIMTLVLWYIRVKWPEVHTIPVWLMSNGIILICFQVTHQNEVLV